MQEMIVISDEQGQRLDRFLKRRLPLAPSSFLYKMLRKKNITLKGKKADGSEKVQEGDVVSLFLSDETIRKFSRPGSGDEGNEKPAEGAFALRINKEKEEIRAYRRIMPLLGRDPVLYEDDNILIVKKVPGILSQKADASDLSMNEWLRGYLKISNRVWDQPEAFLKETAAGFEPSVCNRLDRNTGGILLCAKSLQGSRALSALIRERRIRKTYRMLVHGRILKAGAVQGELIKDTRTNHVSAAGAAPETGALPQTGSVPVKDLQSPGQGIRIRHASTVYRPVKTGSAVSLIEADLITGRSHQLRVHMSSIGHPILFDPRYGNRQLDMTVKEAARASFSDREKLRGKEKPAGKRKPADTGQLLWCTKITFPEENDCEEMRGVLAPLAGKSLCCPFPEWWMNFFY